MLIVMKPNFSQEQLDAVTDKVRRLGYTPHIIPGEHSVAVGITGNHKSIDAEQFEIMDGIASAIRVSKPYKLAGRDFKKTDTVVKVKDAVFGPGNFVVIAGPCAVESEEQTGR